MPDVLALERTKRPAGIRAKFRERACKLRAPGTSLSRPAAAEAAKILGLPSEFLVESFSSFCATGNDVGEYPWSPVPRAIFSVRGRFERDEAGRRHESFAAALADAKPSEEIYWEEIEQCCCLDFDCEDGSDKSKHMLRLMPRPAYWWYSKSNGLHLIYFAMDGRSARDIAQLAALAIALWPVPGVCELKHQTAAPPRGFSECVQGCGSNILPAIFERRGFDPGERDEYLSVRGLEIGGRYPHTQCPIAPSEAGNGTPVVVYDDHIFCFYCHARQKTGLLYYSDVTRQDYGPLELCVENFAHWGHVWHLLSDRIPNEDLARAAYLEALRKRHGPDDMRIPAVFSAGEPKGVVRHAGYWATRDGETLQIDRHSSIIADLPAAKFIDAEGNLRVDPQRREWLCSGVDLTEFGYPPLVKIHGIQLTQFQDRPTDRYYRTAHTAGLKAERNAARRPKYLLDTERLSEEESWAILEAILPGLDRNAITLLIAAKGCSEFRCGLLPMMFFTGPTGSGKSVSVEIAAAICGDAVTKISFSSDERMKQSLMNAKASGSFAFFDEYFKGSARGRISPEDALQALLSFDPNNVSHVLYQGPRALGDLPVCIWADTAIPDGIEHHAQIGRRVVHVPLYSERSWEQPLAAAGIRTPDNLRLLGGPKVLHAANSLISWIMDRYFSSPAATDFAAIARSLGFRKMRDSEIAADRADLIREFFSLVCAEPAATGSESHKFGNTNWVVLHLDRETPLVDAWRSICDPEGYSSRILTETSLESVLGVGVPVVFESRRYGRTFVVRFGTAITAGPRRFNRDILELATGRSNLRGPGDPIGGQFEKSRSGGLSQASLDAINVGGIPL